MQNKHLLNDIILEEIENVVRLSEVKMLLDT
jgi:hypothetical protein